jgi:Tfp pilus assembly protein PilF
LTHGVLLYEPTLRVPLIVSAPGVLRPRVVNTRVSTVDLPPTVAALAGVPFPESPRKLDGRDLSAALKDGGEPAAADVFAETEYPAIFGWSGLSSITRGANKYIASSKPELYDLARDPGETRDVFADERRVMRALSESLTAFRATAATPARANTPDAETMAKLARLGYVGGMPVARAEGSRPSPAVMIPLFRRFEEATWAIGGKRLDEAARILDDLVKQDPQNPVFRASLAKVERQRGRPDRAVPLYREAITDAPDDPEAWYNLAMAFQETGDVRRAGEAVREAIRRDARSPEAHNDLGIVYSGEGKADEALAEFQRAISIDPKSARAYNNMGNVYRSTGRPGEAEAAFRKALELAPAYPDPLNGLGAVQIDRDQPAQAIPYFNRALEIAPDYLEARLSRAVARQISGDAGGAIADYRAFMDRSAGLPAFAAQRRIAGTMLGRLESLQRSH